MLQTTFQMYFRELKYHDFVSNVIECFIFSKRPISNKLALILIMASRRTDYKTLFKTITT